ncbi:MAG: hypothetical protein JSW09_02245 [Pseudomonadota bacterium]|nr:MAG: hypothetical protein JSW09_02245 [Pseudomonadota bacterium]
MREPKGGGLLTNAKSWTVAVLLGACASQMTFASPAGGDVKVAYGWRFEVYANNIPAVDNVAVAFDGEVYATQGLTDGRGTVVRVEKGGPFEVVLADLNHANGLYVRGRYLYVSEEIPDGRVLQFDLCGGGRHLLATLRNPEGVDMLPDGDLIVSEDSVSGRVVRIQRNGTVETLLAGLNRPEGIAVAKNGTVFVAETATGRILAYRRGEIEVIVHDLDEPDHVAVAADGALWITEDTPSGRLLRFHNGMLETVLSGLKAPQGIAFLGDGTVLVAEQDRSRILAVMRKPSP